MILVEIGDSKENRKHVEWKNFLAKKYKKKESIFITILNGITEIMIETTDEMIDMTETMTVMTKIMSGEMTEIMSEMGILWLDSRYKFE